MSARTLCCLLLLGLALGQVQAEELPPVDSEHWTDEYDAYFRKYSKRYFGAHFDWRWFKAQAIAESHLKPAAESPVGAQGIMQIMPGTFYEIKEANPHFMSIKEPRWNIAAGIYYDRMLFRKWQRQLSEQERLLMAFASYNAGLGSIRKAYKRSPEPIRGWQDVAAHAPKETRGYVSRIQILRGKDLRRKGPASKGIWQTLSDKLVGDEAS